MPVFYLALQQRRDLGMEEEGRNKNARKLVFETFRMKGKQEEMDRDEGWGRFQVIMI